MKTGISSSCYYPRYTEDAFLDIARRGAGVAEIFFNAPSELEPAFVDRLDAVRREYGVDVVSVHPYSSGFETVYFFGDYPRRLDDGIAFYGSFFAAAQKLGARYVVFHGCHRGKPILPQFYAERLELLDRAAAEYGVELLQENVDRCVSREPEFIAALRRLLPGQGFVLDVKQAIRAGYSPYAMLEAMGPNIRHVHISDHDARRDCLPVGAGVMDFGKLRRALEAQGFDGAVIEELYSDSFSSDEELWTSFRTLQGLFPPKDAGKA